MIAAVARIVFTQQLRRFTEAPAVDTPAATLRAALDAAFALNPQLRGYVLDDQGHLRGNVVAFVDGRRCRERVRLDDPLSPDSQVHVMQALSGG
jgi:molybdopterin synthase sulfur carrier subunit